MKIEKLDMGNVKNAYACLHNPPPQSVFWQNFLPQSRLWLKQNLGEYVDGYHLVDKGHVVGHIYYVTSERALTEYEIEPNVAFIYCVYLWKEHRGRGFGRRFLNYFKEEMQRQGFKGIITEASDFPKYMHYSHFQKQGFKTVLNQEPFKLMYFPLAQREVKVKTRELRYEPKTIGVEVTLFRNFFCPVSAGMYQKVKEVAGVFGDRVSVVELEANRKILEKHGTVNGILINGKRKFIGPASDEEIYEAIREELTV